MCVEELLCEGWSWGGIGRFPISHSLVMVMVEVVEERGILAD